METFRIGIVSAYSPQDMAACAVRMRAYVRHFSGVPGTEVHFFIPGSSRIQRPSVTAEQVEYSSKQELSGLLREKDVNILLATSPPGGIMMDALYASLANHIPLVLDIRDPWAYSELMLGTVKRRTLKYAKHFWFEKLMFRMARKILVANEELRQLLVSFYGARESKMTVVPNGVDASVFSYRPGTRAEVRSRLGLTDDHILIASEGIAAPYRELDSFVRSFAGAVRSNPRIHVLMLLIADQARMDSIASTARVCGIGSNVHVMQAVPYEDLPGYLSAADAGFVSSSDAFSYQLPVKTFEYLACRLPIVCKTSSKSALTTLISGFSLGFAAHSWEDFAAMLEKACRDIKGFRASASEGQKAVIEKFDREKAAKTAFDELWRAAGREGTSPGTKWEGTSPSPTPRGGLTPRPPAEAGLSVVIPAYNRREYLSKCLESLSRQNNTGPFEVIVVDDGSTDGTGQMAEEFPGNSTFSLRCLRQDRKGQAAARNLGIRNSGARVIAFVDSDVVLHPDWACNLLEHFKKDGVAAVEGKTVPEQEEEATFFTHQTRNLSGRQYNTCNIAYASEVFRKAGVFDETFGGPYTYREDSDLAFRVLAAGWDIVFAPDVIAYHPLLSWGWRGPLRFALRSYYDPLLFKKHPEMFRKYTAPQNRITAASLNLDRLFFHWLEAAAFAVAMLNLWLVAGIEEEMPLAAVVSVISPLAMFHACFLARLKNAVTNIPKVRPRWLVSLIPFEVFMVPWIYSLSHLAGTFRWRLWR